MEYVRSDCDNCGADIRVMATGSPDEEQTLTGWLQVEHGWCLDLSGSYNMFTDLVLEDRSFLSNVSLCHDCCLKITRALSGVFAGQSGMHSTSSTTSCCEFSWSIDEHGCQVHGDGNGGWIEVIGPDGIIIE
jgi:hypothetical protein